MLTHDDKAYTLILLQITDPSDPSDCDQRLREAGRLEALRLLVSPPLTLTMEQELILLTWIGIELDS